ncbi:LytTR family DNA-binding domain-containing protein [Maricaulis sp.]|uniref:LytR/AlgR family response regulator transcription factor n=1 Tax=Maricaulis sp. TaxID=1486257 RepID=UPI001B1DFC79|nr:LytTR family DNA-binding domain-containing protein [Maricaulis sp.]MBO6795990.1 response regulator transcription factor [Maricaulis sp.]
MNILIVEDEYPAAERLMRRLQNVRPDHTVLGVVEGVAEADAWFRDNPPPDLVFFDIRLADGTCFDLFEIREIPCPAIFCTAHDEYALEAFRSNGIAYLLKPVDETDLAAAFDKLDRLRGPSAEEQKQAVRKAGLGDSYKTRLLISTGNRLRPVPIREIACFQARDKGVLAHLNSGESYFVDFTLNELEDALDPQDFFRISRALLPNIAAIDQADRSGGHWQVRLKTLDGEHTVSRQRVSDFKRWFSR